MARLSARADDAFLGNYEGVLKADRSQTAKATAKVVAEGPVYYRVVVQAEPLAAGDTPAQFEIFGVRQGAKVNLFGRANALSWHGTLGNDMLTADPGYYGMGLELRKTTKRSPTELAKPPAGAVVLLPYSPGQVPDADAWRGGTWKPQEDGSLQPKGQPSRGLALLVSASTHIRHSCSSSSGSLFVATVR
jgi:hypothetical protein